jgi:hypothetical protein
MRLGLDLITRLDISSVDKATVFNRLFPDDSISGPYPRGVPWSVLRSQLRERKKNERTSQAWNDLLRQGSSRRQSLQEEVSTILREGLEFQNHTSNSSPLTGNTQSPALMLTRRRARHLERSSAQPDTPSSKRIRVLDRVEIAISTDTTKTSLTLTEPRTPTKNRQDNVPCTPATIRLERRIGPVLQLTPEKHARLSEKYAQPSEEILRLDPDDNLFFRFVLPLPRAVKETWLMIAGSSMMVAMAKTHLSALSLESSRWSTAYPKTLRRSFIPPMCLTISTLRRSGLHFPVHL